MSQGFNMWHPECCQKHVDSCIICSRSYHVSNRFLRSCFFWLKNISWASTLLLGECEMPEQGGNLFLEFWVQADQEDRVDEAQDGACIETPRPPLRVPTDREKDAQRPPDEKLEKWFSNFSFSSQNWGKGIQLSLSPLKIREIIFKFLFLFLKLGKGLSDFSFSSRNWRK